MNQHNYYPTTAAAAAAPPLPMAALATRGKVEARKSDSFSAIVIEEGASGTWNRTIVRAALWVQILGILPEILEVVSLASRFSADSIVCFDDDDDNDDDDGSSNRQNLPSLLLLLLLPRSSLLTSYQIHG